MYKDSEPKEILTRFFVICRVMLCYCYSRLIERFKKLLSASPFNKPLPSNAMSTSCLTLSLELAYSDTALFSLLRISSAFFSSAEASSF